MKTYFFVCIALLCALCVQSQKKIDLATAEPYSLILKDELYPGTGKLPFKEIIVKDYRFDTTKIGYIRIKGIRKIVFEKNPSESFTELLNHYYKAQLDSTSNKSLVIVLKTYWLQQFASEWETEEKITTTWAGEDKSGICFSEFEVFSFSNNHYQALLKLDYEFLSTNYRSRKLRQFFYFPFDSMAKRIKGMDVDNVLATKRKFTAQELENNYISRFNLPILKKDPPTRGVFLTFEDFKQNKISHPEFSAKQGSLTDELYIGDGTHLLTDYWGFFDGKDYFIHIGFNFFKMVRQNNTFDFWGARNITRENSTAGYYDYRSGAYPSMTIQTTKLNLRALQLDMSLGEVY